LWRWGSLHAIMMIVMAGCCTRSGLADVGVDADDDRLTVDEDGGGGVPVAAGDDQGLARGAGCGRLHGDGDDEVVVLDFCGEHGISYERGERPSHRGTVNGGGCLVGGGAGGPGC